MLVYIISEKTNFFLVSQVLLYHCFLSLCREEWVLFQVDVAIRLIQPIQNAFSVR